jgi:MFS transporter, DHA2 family, multidrug resistance protein
VALVALGLAMLHVTTLTPQIDFWDVSWARSYQVFALPFLFIPISAASYVGLPANKNNEAAAISNLMRNLGGSIGVAFAAIWLQYRTQFHHARLAEHVTDATVPHGQALLQLGQTIQTQASFMAYIDVYYMLALIAFCVWPITLLLKSPKKGAPIGH